MTQALHAFLDLDYGPDGDRVLRRRLQDGANPNLVDGNSAETPLHVAARRRRASAVTLLLDHGAALDATNGSGKTAYAHAVRRGFTEIAALLAERGADIELNAADRLAVAVVDGQLDTARQLLAEHPGLARTGNPEEDRLLADIAGRAESAPVALLVAAGADLAARGLDDGTPLHQAAWFGQPANARLLIEAGAPLEVFDDAHRSSPLGWAVHGSRYSGGAKQHQDRYLELARMLIAAGAKMHYPGDPDGDAYQARLLADATPPLHELLRRTAAGQP